MRSSNWLVPFALFCFACGARAEPAAPTTPGPTPTAAIDDASIREAGEPSDAGPATRPISGDGLAPVTEVDDTLVNQFVLPHTQEVLRCYRASLKEHPGIEGALVLTWTIEANGSVSHLTVDGSSTLKDEQTRSCAMKIIAAIQFPPNSRGKSSAGRVPYQFTREGHAKDKSR